MSGPARAFARLVVFLRFPIVLAWIVGAAWLTVNLPTLAEAQTGSLGDLVPTSSEAIEAELRSKRLFGFPVVARSVLVERRPDGLSARRQVEVAQRARALNDGDYPGLTSIEGALPITNAFGAPPFSRERSTTALTYLFFRPEIGPVGRTGLTERLIERRVEEDEGTFVGATGLIAARAAQGELIRDSLPLITLLTVVLVAGAVGVHFRTVGPPLVTLLTVGVAYLVSVRLLAYVAERVGVSVPREVEPVIVALLFGVVTDYVIFLLSRFRSRLTEGDPRREAAIGTTAELMPIILTAGLAIVGASLALSVAELGFLRAFGPGMAMAVAIGMLTALTLVPALFAILGSFVFWPRRTGGPGPGEGLDEAGARVASEPRRRLSAVSIATRRPRATALICTLLLLGGASGVIGLRSDNAPIRGLPADSEPAQAYRQATAGFAPGVVAPTVIVVEGAGIVVRRRELARLGRLIDRQPGVAEVVGPGDQPFSTPLGATLSGTGDAARFVVILSADPLGRAAVEDLSRLGEALPVLLERAGLASARVGVAGDTALVAETVSTTGGDILRVAPLALVALLVVLVVFLRALVAPLYLLAASLLALLATLGLAAYVFQGWLGHPGITYYVVFASSVLLLALGSDYNVFLVGRIWQEARRRPLAEAVRVAGARAATSITVAGLVLALSFALMALVPIRPFRELAFTMAAGLLIDAFLVRTLLVPALIVLVGERSAWPNRRMAVASKSRLPD